MSKKEGAVAFLTGYFTGRWIAVPVCHTLYWVLAISAFWCGYTYGG